MSVQKIDGQTAQEWSDEYFQASDCTCCGKGPDHHVIIDLGGLWFAKCYEIPKVKQVVVIWDIDETGYGSDLDGYDPSKKHIYCKAMAVVTVSYGQVNWLESFESSGLYGIAAVKQTTAFRDLQMEVEKDEFSELRIKLAHFGVDLETFEEAIVIPNIQLRWVN